jgi:hypothetical protein
MLSKNVACINFEKGQKATFLDGRQQIRGTRDISEGSRYKVPDIFTQDFQFFSLSLITLLIRLKQKQKF